MKQVTREKGGQMERRDNFLMIRLSEGERAAVDQLARFERLPTSSAARRLLVLAALQRGIPVLEDSNRAPSLTAAGAVAK